MQATMELFSPPSDPFPVEISSEARFAHSKKQLWKTISTGFVQSIISHVAQKIWTQNQLACEKNNIFCQKDIQMELSLRLFEEATKNVDDGILGLKCPQAWNDISFSTQSYVYKIVYYLGLRSIYCSETLWNGLPREEYNIHYSLLLENEDPSQEQERALFFESYLAYFKPLSGYFLQQKLLSPSSFFIFALFHFPQELAPKDWEHFLSFFPNAQPEAFMLFQQSPFRQLCPEEGSKFTARIQFLSWLLLGAGYLNLAELQRSPQANHLYTNIRQAKNSSRKKIFRYLLCLLLCCELPSLQEMKPVWERLLYKYLKLNPLALIKWKQNNGTMEELYTIIFTSCKNFQQYRESNHLGAHRYRNFIQRFTTLQHSFYDYWQLSLSPLSN